MIYLCILVPLYPYLIVKVMCDGSLEKLVAFYSNRTASETRMQSQLRRDKCLFFSASVFHRSRVKTCFWERAVFLMRAQSISCLWLPEGCWEMFKNWIRLDFKALKWSKWDAVSAHTHSAVSFWPLTESDDYSVSQDERPAAVSIFFVPSALCGKLSRFNSCNFKLEQNTSSGIQSHA